MPSELNATPISKGALWTGRILSTLPGLLLLFDGVMKIANPAEVVKGTTALGYPENTITPIGIALVISAIIYLIPATNVLGALLLTGYLGGAVASHVRHGDGPEILGPVIVAAVFWSGMLLKDRRLRSILPWRR